ncbi:MAG TPA: hypothetical protein VJS37_16240 [Terriglobales bacterium]|jgi:hypothetical protein|nr:hypothetical protein [Terriglobales bacterium]
MPDGPELVKSWQQLAAELGQENDPEKINKLITELLQAMNEETRQAYARLQIATKPPQKAA